MNNSCKNCEKSITGFGYCGKECAQEHRRKNLRKIECLICKCATLNGKFCGKECELKYAGPGCKNCGKHPVVFGYCDKECAEKYRTTKMKYLGCLNCKNLATDSLFCTPTCSFLYKGSTCEKCYTKQGLPELWECICKK
jgi:hypothetical protein